MPRSFLSPAYNILTDISFFLLQAEQYKDSKAYSVKVVVKIKNDGMSKQFILAI